MRPVSVVEGGATGGVVVRDGFIEKILIMEIWRQPRR
jgi:hypothetical protein